MLYSFQGAGYPYSKDKKNRRCRKCSPQNGQSPTIAQRPVSGEIKLWDNGTRVNQAPGMNVTHPGSLGLAMTILGVLAIGGSFFLQGENQYAFLIAGCLYCLLGIFILRYRQGIPKAFSSFYDD
ncbi:MAG: hypothetical protein Q8939_18445 [Bacteroidota bacterium]|nr:hypothetical protein [Bacteroidota bacterium]